MGRNSKNKIIEVDDADNCVMDLNEGNVQAIFNRCLATDSDSIEDTLYSMLFQKIYGYDEDSKPIFFNKKKLEQDKKNIYYLLGQLRSTHNNNRQIYAKESVYKYDNTKWTSDTVKLMELYHLADASSGIDPFIKENNYALLNIFLIKPTLSPKDPNFPAWWEEHKSEWETPKKDGQEPADD